MKPRLISILFFVLLLSQTACDPDFYETSCDNCFQDKPTVGLLTVAVLYNGTDSIPIKIFKGRSIEKGEQYITDTIGSDIAEFWVDVGSHYSVEAEYFIGGRTYNVVDSDKVAVFLDESNCDEVCWRPNDGHVDCKITQEP